MEEQILVKKDETTEVDITLKRWIHMVEKGWYSGDLHCHFGLDDLKVLKQLALADDVCYEPILTLWNHRADPTQPTIWPERFQGRSAWADSTHVVTFHNQEVERIGGEPFESVGALQMLGLTEPVKMPPPKSNYPCDAVLGAAAKKASPSCVIDTDKPMWAENVVGVALGLFDSVQICHNHYHRESTMGVCCGMAIDSTTRAQENWGEDEIFHLTNLTYYRFLNCGFRLAVTGGSAMGVMPVPLGYNRTYAKLGGPLTEANYLKAIRAGRTFATSGPMLFFTVDGFDGGSEIKYSTGQSKAVSIKAELQSIHPVDSLELISKGKVIKQIDLSNRTASPVLKEVLTTQLRPVRSGWVAARCIFTAPDGRSRQAHTSGVYITVDGKPTASKADAEYMMRWIDQLLRISRKPDRYESETERAQVQKTFRKARQIYEDIARKAVELWGQ